MGIFDNKVVATPIEDAFKMTKSMYAGYESLIKRLS